MFGDKFGWLAQLAEQLAFNQLVIGSNPMPPTSFDARYNQLVDGQPHTLSVAGSSPALATSFAYVAQLVRVRVSYALGRKFESCHMHQFKVM